MHEAAVSLSNIKCTIVLRNCVTSEINLILCSQLYFCYFFSPENETHLHLFLLWLCMFCDFFPCVGQLKFSCDKIHKIMCSGILVISSPLSDIIFYLLKLIWLHQIDVFLFIVSLIFCSVTCYFLACLCLTSNLPAY